MTSSRQIALKHHRRQSAVMNPPPRRVLVIVTRRIGDVLLATPVFRSLRQAWPDMVLDALCLAARRMFWLPMPM
jgi:hypothetical protein